MKFTIKSLLTVLMVASAASTYAQTNFVILDEYTNMAPTGTSYARLRQYDQYIDAGSTDASPFVITRTTDNPGGILFFFGFTEFQAGALPNTYRLTATDSNFDFNSFYFHQLQDRDVDDEESQFPSALITASNGSSIGFTSASSSGSQTLNWSNVEWVDFTITHANFKFNSMNLTTVSAVPEPSTFAAAMGLAAFGVVASRRRKRRGTVRADHPARES